MHKCATRSLTSGFTSETADRLGHCHYAPDSNNLETSRDVIEYTFSDSRGPIVTSSLKGTFLRTVMYIITASQCSKS